MSEARASGSDAPRRPDTGEASPAGLRLAAGRRVDLTTLSAAELRRLHWEQERIFARRILESRKGSAERAEARRDGYDTVHAILAARRAETGDTLVLGMKAKHSAMTLQLLEHSRRADRSAPLLFEIGYGTGSLLVQARRRGFDCAGIEISSRMVASARRALDAAAAQHLLAGDFLVMSMESYVGRCDIVYWNDVFEHLHPDEALDYLRKIHRLLVPGGTLITITPNWHRRPADVTRHFAPPRTPAQGFHLKEYRLREVYALLREAGFRRIATPLAVTPGRTWLLGRGLVGLKRAGEPLLEYLPYRLARLLCRGLGLGCTLATRPR